MKLPFKPALKSAGYLILFILSFRANPAFGQLNLDNIGEIKQLYLDREWFKADTLFYEGITGIQDSVLKESLLLDWGIFMVEQHDYDWGEKPLLWTIELSKYNKHPETEAQAYLYLGELYYLLEILLQSQQYYLDALSIFETLNDSLGIGRCYDGLADNYSTIGDYESALEYYFKADTVFTEIGASDLRSNIMGNIGDMARAYGHLDSSRVYIEKALAIDGEINNIHNMVAHTSSMAYIYAAMDSIEKAFELHHKSLNLAHQSDDILDLGFSNQHLGFHHYHHGDIDSAKHYMLKTLQIAEEKSNSQLMTNVAGLLSEIYAQEKDFGKAYEYMKYYSEASDTLFSDQNILGLAYMKSKYAIAQSEADKELLRRDAEISAIKLKNQKITNYFLGFAAVIFLGAFGWVLYYAQQRRKINQQLRKDRDTIKAQAEQLEEMDRYKSRFFSNISHDFRAPLALIKGYAEILKQENDDLNEISETALMHIDASVNRLNDMTDEIRDLVRLQEKRVHLKYAKIHVNAFFGMLGDMFASAAASRGMTLDFKSELEWDHMIHADKYALEKIIFNLIDNALKYNTTGEKIGFFIDEVDHKIQVRICDDGPGIDQEKIPLVFERFYQSNEKSHSAIEGSGIGLNVVKEYVELHGGEINVTSIPHEETCFKFTLPYNLDQPLVNNEVVGNVLDEQLRKVLEKRKVALSFQQEKHLTKEVIPDDDKDANRMILIVDDHPGIREYLSKILSDEFLVLEASNGEEAMYILQTTSDIALVITDLMMPKMSGQELIDNIKKSPRLIDIPLLVISANKEMEDQYIQLSENQFAYISKPFDAEDILDKIDRMVNVQN
jgi:signal transduction histidine kinase/ActR/RegA family two-component response regulator